MRYSFRSIGEAVEETLWCRERTELPFFRRQLVTVGRVLHLAATRSQQHEIFLHASALTLFSLLAVVPVLATLFGIAKGFGLAELVESQIREAFATQEQVMNLLMTFSKRSLDHAQGGVIAGIGIVILIWAVIRMVGNVERAFNLVWGVQRARTFFRKLTDYLFLVLLLPLLLVFSSSVTVVLSAGIHDVVKGLQLPEDAVTFVIFFTQFLPALLLGCGFGFLYAFLPNTTVRPLAAALGGLITAVLFLLSQWAYVQFQFALASYGAIYGSFAALPLFLIWLQAAWLLVLFGAELTHAIELRDELEFEPYSRELSIAALFESAKLVAAQVANRMVAGEGPPTVDELSADTGLPASIIHVTVERMQEAKLLTRDEYERWVPIIPTNQFQEETVL
ncbi:YihY/virulence factor BrkB family protein, partial [bacterium]|nr:YihY/virulence factor BrkB family protein [bacterium]